MKTLYLIIGFLFFGLGAIGVILPVLPTTPFLLVASYCFARGSKRFNDWFLSTRIYQKHLDSFVKERSMTLKTKISLLSFASAMLILAFCLVDVIYARILIIAVIIFKYYYFIFRIKTIREVQND
ncbi:YbaN family protein [Eubacterium sp. 1001713B170207_170306_E7]|uniref:YbaN family protein n=1 Tax=Eubacterium sp. 1001713B170207_170306_E7 TaxID=2787097 RepID=UPI00189ADC53|nr:YbaN family protein [Eubacterium sp. 1001713B170207_170306_E7]